MDFDFTLEKYRELCNVIANSDYRVLTVKDFLTGPKPLKSIIIRHDVDRDPKSALGLAEVEKSLGLVSTYYFRAVKGLYKPSYIIRIARLGHEIGYHYEVLDTVGGNRDKAINLFRQELGEFRTVANIKTICMHGNPLSSHNNLDLWKQFDFKDYGIIGEPYLSMDFNNVAYFTDTGRTWADKYSIKDVVAGGSHEKIRTTEDLINLIIRRQYKKMFLVAHPYRWSTNLVDWVKEYVIQNIENFGKSLIK